MPRIPLPAKFEDGDFSTFRKSFERVATANGWKDNAVLLAVLPVVLGGRALVAFERKEKSVTTIEEAWKVLEDEFNSTLDRENAMKEFYNCQWGIGLDPGVYSAKLKSFLKKGLPSLTADDVDRMVISQFINGFSGSHQENLRLLFSGKSPSLSEVVSTAKDLVRQTENACHAVTKGEQSGLESRINELSDGLQALTARVAAVTDRRGENSSSDCVGHEIRNPDKRWTRGRMQCFNCSGFGHKASSCPSPRSRRPSGNGRAGDRRPTASLR